MKDTGQERGASETPQSSEQEDQNKHGKLVFETKSRWKYRGASMDLISPISHTRSL